MSRETMDDELKELLKRMMQIMMEKERASFLGYEKGKPIVASGLRRANHRDGHYERNFLSALGLMEDVKVPVSFWFGG